MKTKNLVATLLLVGFGLMLPTSCRKSSLKDEGFAKESQTLSLFSTEKDSVTAGGAVALKSQVKKAVPRQLLPPLGATKPFFNPLNLPFDTVVVKNGKRMQGVRYMRHKVTGRYMGFAEWKARIEKASSPLTASRAVLPSDEGSEPQQWCEITSWYECDEITVGGTGYGCNFLYSEIRCWTVGGNTIGGGGGGAGGSAPINEPPCPTSADLVWTDKNDLTESTVYVSDTLRENLYKTVVYSLGGRGIFSEILFVNVDKAKQKRVNTRWRFTELTHLDVLKQGPEVAVSVEISKSYAATNVVPDGTKAETSLFFTIKVVPTCGKILPFSPAWTKSITKTVKYNAW